MKRGAFRLLQAVSLFALGSFQLMSTRSLAAEPVFFAECTLCESSGCPSVAERQQLCETKCNITDNLPSCNFWGDECDSSLDGEIICAGNIS